MERIDPTAPDSDANWASNDPAVARNGLDANGDPISGTPRCRNSAASPAADLVVEKTAPPYATAGERIGYTIRLRNAGNVTATTVRLTDTLPPGTDFYTHTATYTFTRPANDTLVWEIGTLPVSTALASFTVLADVAHHVSGPITNVLTATTTITEAAPTNDAAWASTTVSQPQPDLEVRKSGPTAVAAGAAITYHVVLSNIGAAPATDVVVSDTLPARVHYSAESHPPGFHLADSGPTVVWTATAVVTGTPYTFVITGLVSDTASGLLVNRVVATTTDSETLTANNSAAFTTTAVIAHDPLDVVINEVAWMGTDADYRHEWIELHNTTGQEIDLYDWQLSDHDGLLVTLTGTIPPGGYYLVAQSTSTFSTAQPGIDQLFSGNLRNDGEAITLTDSSGAVIDTANVERGYDNGWAGGSNTSPRKTMERIDPTAPDSDANWCTNDPAVARNGLDANGDPINGTPRAPNSCYQPPSVLPTDLAVSKRGPTEVEAGALITYHVTLSNTGPVTAAGVRLTDTLPAAVTFVAQTSPFTFSPQGRTLTWEVGEVVSGTAHAITVTGQVAGTAVYTLTLTNRVTATTSTSETVLANNTAVWDTAITWPATTDVRITALHYYGYAGFDDEAVRLTNVGSATAHVGGWYLANDPTAGQGVTLPPDAALAPGASVWCAKNAVAFAAEFGFKPDYERDGSDASVLPISGSWPGFANSGDECALFDADGRLIDVLSYGNSTSQVGWSGPAVQPWTPSTAFARTGQILYRKLDQATGHPVPDTNTAADWAQDPNDHVNGRKVRYPGWDLEEFFHTVKVTQTATLVVAVAPDNAYEVIARYINSATTSILIEGYTFENAHLVDAVIARAQAGVTVRVLLEGGQVTDQQRWFCQRLHAAGGAAYFLHNDVSAGIYDRYTNQHAKFIIVDGRTLILGSENFNYSGLPADDKSNGTWGRRGTFLVTDAPGVVTRAQAIFDRDLDPTHHKDVVPWSPDHPRYGPPSLGFSPTYVYSDWVTYTVAFSQPLVLTDTVFALEVVQSPENSLRDSDSLLGLVALAGAGDTILVEQMYEREHWGPTASTPATDPNPRLEAYIAAARRGARVRILLNGSFDTGSVLENTATCAYVNQIARSERLNLAAGLGDPAGRGIHNKMVLVWLDESGEQSGYAHVGSINGSEASSKLNRELALQVKSDAVYDYLARVFEHDWWLAHPLFLPLVMRNYAPPPPPVDYVVISEVMYRPAGQTTGNREWVELYNPTHQPVDLSGWYLGDAAAAEEYGAGLYRFPADSLLPAGGVIVVAQQAVDFEGVGGFTKPHFEFLIDPHRDDPEVPNMEPVGAWSGFGFALGDAGDRVILRKADGTDVDVVVYGAATYPGITPHAGGLESNWSLERRPPYYDSDDCSVDFIPRYPATPGSVPES